LTFCTCRAGHMQRQYLRKKLADILEKSDYVPPQYWDEVEAQSTECPPIHLEVV
jgi:hypothetical protein